MTNIFPDISNVPYGWHPQVVVESVEQVGRAQHLGVYSIRVGQSRLRTRIRTTTMILIDLALPSIRFSRCRNWQPILFYWGGSARI
jgi:hypothetical protein